jgi:hypothetical protein
MEYKEYSAETEYQIYVLLRVTCWKLDIINRTQFLNAMKKLSQGRYG